VLAGKLVTLTLLGQTPVGGAAPSVTQGPLAQLSTASSSTPSGLPTSNQLLSRDKISAPQAVDVSMLPQCHSVIDLS